LVHIPTGYQAEHPTPVVLNYHGYSSNGEEIESYTQFSQKADREQFIVVYPYGTGPILAWSVSKMCNFETDDVLFTSDLLNKLQQDLCIDNQRIYATGFSNGGGMVNLLACKLSKRIAAFAPVSGASSL
jgi:polyhydroxybutyrate depolymerase